MTVAQMKDWLTQRDHGDAVWELTNRKPAAKKSDWQELMRAVAGGM